MRKELAVVRARERGLTERPNEVERRMRAAEEQSTKAVQPATDAQRRIETQLKVSESLNLHMRHGMQTTLKSLI